MAEGRRYVRFLPLETTDNGLFEGRYAFQQRLDNVVQSVTRTDPNPLGQSLCFALHGRWGSGKSTALRYIKDGAARALGTDRIVNLEAPLWEGRASARAVVAYAVARTAGIPDLVPTATMTFERAVGRTRQATQPDQDHELYLALRFFAAFDSGAGSGPVLEEWLVKQIAAGSPGVVLIDDLDRCHTLFTAEILQATAFWTTLGEGKVNFVLASDRDHLCDSMSVIPSAQEIAPELALQKYVQVHIDVPPYFSHPRDVGKYLSGLIPLVEFPGVSPQPVHELQVEFQSAAKRYPDGPLAPLLRVEDGITPRAVKERVNAFLADFNPAAAPAGTFGDDLKLRVIMALWPDFWWRYLSRAVQPTQEDGAATERVVVVTRAATPLYRALWDAPVDTVSQALQAAAGLNAPLLDGVDVRLALYLAADPQWKPPPGDDEARLRTVHTPGGDLSPRNQMLPDAERSIADQVLYLYLTADGASKSSEINAGKVVAQALDSILALGGSLRPEDAATVGNAALVAERMDDIGRARDLHALAAEINPKHWNVIQNYVDFILSENLTDLMNLAEELIGRLRTEGSEHKPERTKALEARLASQRGSPTAVPQTLEKVSAQVRAGGRLQDLKTYYRVFTDLKGYRELMDVGHLVAARVRTADEFFTVLRLTADGCGDSDDPAIERQAAEIYRFILAEKAELPDREDIEHNLAVLLNSVGLKEGDAQLTQQALALWLDIYARGLADGPARRALARALNRANREADALAVMRGQQLDVTPESAPSLAELPPLVPPDQQWWSHIPIPSGPPGPPTGAGDADGR